MRPPGVVFRASHVLVFLVIIVVLAFGVSAAVAGLMNPGPSVVGPAVEGLRGR